VVVALVFLVISLIPKEPMERFESMREDMVESVAESVSDMYDTYSGTFLQAATGSVPAMGANGKLRLEIDPSILSSMAPGMGMDMTWLSEIGLDMEVYTDETGAMKVLAELLLGGQEIVSIDVIQKGNTMYVGLPDMSDTYVQVGGNSGFGYGDFDFEDYDAYSDFESAYSPYSSTGFYTGTSSQTQMAMAGQVPAALMEQIEDLLPDAGMVEDMINRYGNAFLGSFQNITFAPQNMVMGSYQEELMVYTLTVNEYDLLKGELAVIEEMMQDGDLEDYINDLASTFAPGQNAYAGLVAELNEEATYIREKLQRAQAMGMQSDEYVKLVIYLNDDDEVAGLELYLADGGYEEEIFRALTVSDGSDFIFAAYAADVAVQGEGSRSGSAISGDFTLTVDGQVLGSLGLEDMEMSMDSISGEMRITPSRDVLLDMLGSDAAMITALNPSLVLDFDLSDSGGTFGVTLASGDKELVCLSMDSEQTSGQDVEIPEKVVPESAADQWVMTLDLEDLQENLEDAGVPATLIAQLLQEMGMGY